MNTEAEQIIARLRAGSAEAVTDALIYLLQHADNSAPAPESARQGMA